MYIMSTYEIDITRPASRGHRNLDRQVQRKIDQAITSLRTEPRPAGVKALQGDLAGYYRLAVTAVGGHYRITYKVDDTARRIEIAYIGPRENAYD